MLNNSHLPVGACCTCPLRWILPDPMFGHVQRAPTIGISIFHRFAERPYAELGCNCIFKVKTG